MSVPTSTTQTSDDSCIYWNNQYHSILFADLAKIHNSFAAERLPSHHNIAVVGRCQSLILFFFFFFFFCMLANIIIVTNNHGSKTCMWMCLPIVIATTYTAAYIQAKLIFCLTGNLNNRFGTSLSTKHQVRRWLPFGRFNAAFTKE